MLDVLIALVPALIASVVLFGFRALAVTAVSVGSCVLFEFLSRKAMRRPNTIGDLSAAATGMILAFNLPASIPFWMVVFGALISIVVVKQMFGGIGQNFVNPALLARIVLMVSFPKAMLASWPTPFAWRSASPDAITSATPLAILKSGDGTMPSLFTMCFAKAGCVGEVCAAALVLGGVYLMIRRVISPVIPLCFIDTVGVCMLVYGLTKEENAFTFALYELVSGGLLLGAFFMATDYATSPVSIKGKIVFAIGCGLITSLIRLFGNMNEGVSFSIVLMNILVPHIDRLTVPKPFGMEKEKKEKKAEVKAS
jgi:electron transport complex protein RnfD